MAVPMVTAAMEEARRERARGSARRKGERDVRGRSSRLLPLATREL